MVASDREFEPTTEAGADAIRLLRDSAKSVRRRKRGLLLAAGLLILVILALGWWWLAAGLSLLAYLLNEVLLADQIFYDPRSDYAYRFSVDPIDIHWRDGALRVPHLSDSVDTLLLQVVVTATRVGRVFDPWVELSDGRRRTRQYFERGVGGLRYLNLTAFRGALAEGGAVGFKLRHCSLAIGRAQLYAFASEPALELPMLIVAPHADDAEIAAFGLYSQVSDCTIVTVTAGETDAEQFVPWVARGEQALCQAAQFKGEIRALNGVAAAIWGGVPQERCISLGYGCLQLEAMRADPQRSLTSPYSALADTRPYRRMNRVRLPSDGDGAASWHHLIADLASVLAQCRPAVVVTAHPILDKHRDHVSATRAIWQAVQSAQLECRWLLYANHLETSQYYPFGPAHSELGLPPHIGYPLAVEAIYSVPLDAQTQRLKALSLDLMHDLKRPVRWKKWLRKRLQWLFLRRSITPYGEDDFFRKAVRSSEVFVVAEHPSMAELMSRL